MSQPIEVIINAAIHSISIGYYAVCFRVGNDSKIHYYPIDSESREIIKDLTLWIKKTFEKDQEKCAVNATPAANTP
jgi:hypothetical protein